MAKRAGVAHITEPMIGLHVVPKLQERPGLKTGWPAGNRLFVGAAFDEIGKQKSTNRPVGHTSATAGFGPSQPMINIRARKPKVKSCQAEAISRSSPRSRGPQWNQRAALFPPLPFTGIREVRERNSHAGAGFAGGQTAQITQNRGRKIDRTIFFGTGFHELCRCFHALCWGLPSNTVQQRADAVRL